MMHQPQDIILSAENLLRKAGSYRILNEVYLDIKRGECLGVIGSSGSGKSSLLRALAMLDPLDDGFLTLNGKPLGRGRTREGVVYTEQASARLSVGMVFQDFQLWPHLSVQSNVELAQMVSLGIAQTEATQTALQLLERLKISHLTTAYPSNLSGGQKQRVAIARALALKPQILLFDEPTSALDPELVNDVAQLFMDLKASDLTCVVVSHEMNFIRQVCDRLVFMDQGKIIAQGATEALTRQTENERVRRFFQLISDSNGKPTDALPLSPISQQQ